MVLFHKLERPTTSLTEGYGFQERERELLVCIEGESGTKSRLEPRSRCKATWEVFLLQFEEEYEEPD